VKALLFLVASWGGALAVSLGIARLAWPVVEREPKLIQVLVITAILLGSMWLIISLIQKFWPWLISPDSDPKS